MKIAVSSNGENLDAQLDPRFGRCAYFLLVNPEDMSVEAFNNESAAQGGGAGIQAAQFLASKKVAAVITGNCGPNAVRTLSAAGIKLFGGQAGSVREVIEIFSLHINFGSGSVKESDSGDIAWNSEPAGFYVQICGDRAEVRKYPPVFTDREFFGEK